MSILASDILDNKRAIYQLHEKYRTAKPYPHCVIDPICNREFLRRVHEELTTNLKVDFKETDLFKLFQTAELGTLIERKMKKTMPNLLRLRNALYSDQFRQLVQNITSCGELTNRVDCSSNAYANSCHLLCHDDVIGTRKVSYILYLSDPDEPWVAKDGGSVELYPLEGESVVFGEEAGAQGIPTAHPTKTILPHFNSMLLFMVQPGRSYHSVQEVFAKDRPRLSISGWFHASAPPQGAHLSSLRQITSGTLGSTTGLNDELVDTVLKEDGRFVLLASKVFNAQLSADDLVYLSGFISSDYLTAEAITSISERFCEKSSVQLHSFLNNEWSERVLSLVLRLDREDGLGKGKPVLDYNIGLRDGWVVKGPAHMRRYLSFEESNDASYPSLAGQLGLLLKELADQLMSSLPFCRYLKAITTCVLLGRRREVRRFRCGLDYTVAHAGCLTQEKRLDATICLVNDSREKERGILQVKGMKRRKFEKVENITDGYDSDYEEIWEGGDVGAFECFIEAEVGGENAEAAEVYRTEKWFAEGEQVHCDVGGEDSEDDNAENPLLSVSARHNVFNLVLRDEGTMKFVKFVSANAPGSRYDLLSEFIVDSVS